MSTLAATATPTSTATAPTFAIVYQHDQVLGSDNSVCCSLEIVFDTDCKDGVDSVLVDCPNDLSTLFEPNTKPHSFISRPESTCDDMMLMRLFSSFRRNGWQMLSSNAYTITHQQAPARISMRVGSSLHSTSSSPAYQNLFVVRTFYMERLATVTSRNIADSFLAARTTPIATSASVDSAVINPLNTGTKTATATNTSLRRPPPPPAVRRSSIMSWSASTSSEAMKLNPSSSTTSSATSSGRSTDCSGASQHLVVGGEADIDPHILLSSTEEGLFANRAEEVPKTASTAVPPPPSRRRSSLSSIFASVLPTESDSTTTSTTTNSSTAAAAADECPPHTSSSNEVELASSAFGGDSSNNDTSSSCSNSNFSSCILSDSNVLIDFSGKSELLLHPEIQEHEGGSHVDGDTTTSSTSTSSCSVAAGGGDNDAVAGGGDVGDITQHDEGTNGEFIDIDDAYQSKRESFQFDVEYNPILSPPSHIYDQFPTASTLSSSPPFPSSSLSPSPSLLSSSPSSSSSLLPSKKDLNAQRNEAYFKTLREQERIRATNSVLSIAATPINIEEEEALKQHEVDKIAHHSRMGGVYASGRSPLAQGGRGGRGFVKRNSAL